MGVLQKKNSELVQTLNRPMRNMQASYVRVRVLVCLFFLSVLSVSTHTFKEHYIHSKRLPVYKIDSSSYKENFKIRYLDIRMSFEQPQLLHHRE